MHIGAVTVNKTEDPSVPYAGQGYIAYIRVLNVIEIIKFLKNAKLN